MVGLNNGNHLNMNNIKTVMYGEMHNVQEDIDRIRQQIINQQPDIILHEMYEDDKEFYEEHDLKIQPLEPTFISEKFITRESIMAMEIIKAMVKYENVAVVVGDTHIRNEPLDNDDVVFLRDSFKKYDQVEFLRSPNKEVN